MEPVVEAYREGLAVTRDSPRYVAATVLLSAVGAAASVLLERLPYGVGTLVNAVVVTPLLVAVLVGLAVAALGGQASADEGVASARRHYPTLVGVFAVLVAVALLLVVVAATGSALLALALGWRPPPLSALGAGTGTMPAAGATLWLAMGVVTVPTFLVAFALIQFVDVAVVLDGEGVAGAFLASLRVCRLAPGSVAVYTVARVLVFGVAAAATWLASRLAGRLGGTTAATGVGVGVGLLAVSLAYAVVNASHVAYYRRFGERS